MTMMMMMMVMLQVTRAPRHELTCFISQLTKAAFNANEEARNLVGLSQTRYSRLQRPVYGSVLRLDVAVGLLREYRLQLACRRVRFHRWECCRRATRRGVNVSTG